MANISVKVNGLSETLKSVQAIRQNLKPKVKDLLEATAMMTADVVTDCYSGASAGNGNKDFTVVGRSTSDLSARVHAFGEQVYFLEYGAGDLTLADNPIGGAGSWSKAHSGMYANIGSWKFGGTWYKGLPPSRGMYTGKKFSEQYLAENAKEVFKT